VRIRTRFSAVALAGLAAAARAQVPATGTSSTQPAPRDTVVAAPGAGYPAGRLHRAMLGTNYRALWATPIPFEVLDLSTFAGGLKPTRRGGGLQTRSLRFDGADGHTYVFRSLDKDPSRALPPDLRETLVDQVLQDQVSSFHPASALVVARLLDATRIRHAHPRLVALPDHPLLGEFRADFANQLGTFEERPGPGFDETLVSPGALDEISSEDLFDRLRKSARTRFDAPAFLAARLFDVFVGDRDRHRDQWRWANFRAETNALWEPVPRDRDMAFVKHEGLLLSIARAWYPLLVSFDAAYPGMLGLTWNGREIDRRLLTGLERPVWDSVARALQAQLSDSVIDDAIAAMPAPLVRVNGAHLRRTLVSRRDHLPAAAAEFYRLLAREVDVRGTDAPDLAEVVSLDDGGVEVSLSPLASEQSPSAAAYFRRRFAPTDTKEVRIYLFGGNDRVVLRGHAARRVTVRIVAGAGDDDFVDSSSTSGEPARFYDASGRASRVQGSDARVDRRSYDAPPAKRPQDPHRDWGHEWRPAPWTTYGPEVGLFVGGGRTLYRYGFRSVPYASRITMEAGYALEANRPRALLTAEFRRPNSRQYMTLAARASGIEVIRFFGAGNETRSDEPSDFYRVHQTQYLLVPAYTVDVRPHLTLSLGAEAQYTTTELPSNTLIGATRPYGTPHFGQAGARVRLAVDTRDNPVAAVRGVQLTADGALYPALWDVEHTFGKASGTAATYLSVPAPLDPTLALRVGGEHVWGDVPFHEAAFAGGAATIRGWSEQRFAGRSSVFGNAELRLALARFVLFIPNELGMFGLADAGRVYATGESSSEWHTAFGGGIWLAPLKRTNTVTVGIAHGAERTGLYLRTGFLF